MGPFLAGFCSELTKTAFASETPTPTPVPATGAPTSQRPTGAAAANPRPGSGPIQATYAHAPKAEQWRPSPKYKPKSDGSADELAAKPKAKRGGKPAKDTGNPWKRTYGKGGGAGGGGTQQADKRTTQEQLWGALPKAQKPMMQGESYATRPDIKLPAGSDQRMRGDPKTGKGGSHSETPERAPGRISDQARKETENIPLYAAGRRGGGAAHAKQKQMTTDLMNNQREWTGPELQMDRKPGGSQFATMQDLTPKGGVMGGGPGQSDPKMKEWLDEASKPPPARPSRYPKFK